jgi:hypothetical protein
MLHVLTAQLVADERERAIQRRLRDQSARREAMAAKAARSAQAVPAHSHESHAERPCGACPPVRAAAG